MLEKSLKPLLFVAVVAICLYLARPTPHINLGYYSWTNYYNYQPEEKALFSKGFTKNYLRLLDVDWDPMLKAFPLTKVDFSLENSFQEIIPVVFITNRTMLNATSKDIDELVVRVIDYCAEIDFKEIQFDCDWNKSSRDRFFEFLSKVKAKMPDVIVSSTLRLHQYKYREDMGVPPVDRVCLMLYHTSDFKKDSPQNSIFSKIEALKYLNGPDAYPIPMDFAITVMSWYVHYDQQDRFVELMPIEVGWQKIDYLLEEFDEVLQDTYIVNKEVSFGSSYLAIGDKIKHEYISPQALIESVQLAKRFANSNAFSLVIFERSLLMEDQNYFTDQMIQDEILH
jgi:hypothetical protein